MLEFFKRRNDGFPPQASNLMPTSHTTNFPLSIQNIANVWKEVALLYPPKPLTPHSTPHPAPLKVMLLEETPTHSYRIFHSEYSKHMGTKSEREGGGVCAGGNQLMLLPMCSKLN